MLLHDIEISFPYFLISFFLSQILFTNMSFCYSCIDIYPRTAQCHDCVISGSNKWTIISWYFLYFIWIKQFMSCFHVGIVKHEHFPLLHLSQNILYQTWDIYFITLCRQSWSDTLRTILCWSDYVILNWDGHLSLLLIGTTTNSSYLWKNKFCSIRQNFMAQKDRKIKPFFADRPTFSDYKIQIIASNITVSDFLTLELLQKKIIREYLFYLLNIYHPKFNPL